MEDVALKAFSVIRRNNYGCSRQFALRLQSGYEIDESAVGIGHEFVIAQALLVHLGCSSGVYVGP